MTQPVQTSNPDPQTLLDVLAGRKTQGVIEGSIQFGGQKPSRQFLRKYTGWVLPGIEGQGCGQTWWGVEQQLARASTQGGSCLALRGREGGRGGGESCCSWRAHPCGVRV